LRRQNNYAETALVTHSVETETVILCPRASRYNVGMKESYVVSRTKANAVNNRHIIRIGGRIGIFESFDIGTIHIYAGMKMVDRIDHRNIRNLTSTL
jgi:hypothetical protein